MEQKLKMQRSKSKNTKGLILVFTGNGKGKTTSAMGAALRMISHGKRVGMVQFFKRGVGNGGWGTGEVKVVKKFGSSFRIWGFGGGFTWETAREENLKAAQSAWKKCRELLKDSKYNLVILDEIHIAFRHKFLKVSEVVKALKRRQPGQHVILTGRSAPQAIIHLADLVTEMRCVKHPFKRGVPAQSGIEF